jgi:hypothetical protein
MFQIRDVLFGSRIRPFSHPGFRIRIQIFFHPGSSMKSGKQTYFFLASYAFKSKVLTLVIVKKIRDLQHCPQLIPMLTALVSRLRTMSGMASMGWSWSPEMVVLVRLTVWLMFSGYRPLLSLLCASLFFPSHRHHCIQFIILPTEDSAS